MNARAAFAAVIALFNARPQAAGDALRQQAAHTLEHDGLVSEASAYRIRAAFARFQRFFSGGGG